MPRRLWAAAKSWSNAAASCRSDADSGWVVAECTARCVSRRYSVGVSVAVVSCVTLKLRANAAAGLTVTGPLSGFALYSASEARRTPARNAYACAVMSTPVEEKKSDRTFQNVTG